MHRRHTRIVPMRPSCMEQFGVAIGCANPKVSIPNHALSEPQSDALEFHLKCAARWTDEYSFN